MGAPSDTKLVLQYRANIVTNYKRTDNSLSVSGGKTKDNIQYSDINHSFLNGRGDSRVNLQYHKRRRLINTTETLDLDGILKNVWEQTLNYDAVKFLLIKNRETTDNQYIEVTFKHEHYFIGPGGSRIICEPQGCGMSPTSSSQSEEEGMITITAKGDVTYDIIIVGSDAEKSSSSG